MAATISNTYGALEIGSSVSVFLFGIVTLQSHIYFQRFPDDRFAFRALVASVWSLELGHTIAVVYEVYMTTIVNWGQANSGAKFPAVGAIIILGGFITTLVQLFFSYRLYLVLPKPYNLSGIITGVTALARLVMSTYAGIAEIVAKDFAQYIIDLKPMLTALLSMGAVIDVTIAISMVYFLVQRREKSLTRVTRLIDRLLAFTIRSGLVTSMAAILVLILYRTLPNNLIFLATYTSLAKLYSNSFLSSLNARKSLRDVVGNSVSVEVPRKAGISSRGAFSNAISIEMKTTTEFKADSDF
ncbi:hypothetical protein BDN70DRAFT_879458 [Pholiota conissans]|uniref:DUF6534 domain-containing protein n=1 Tax=Pholiota conissans TaxID=109636 RepID=A0A9P5Z2Z5_9AGAR|nr:hypothetical protein BDN70DRAFT_879458 [Pholiota conissans]